MGKYFGTDGFRGEANKVLTADHAYKIGRYLGWYYNQNHKGRIVLEKIQEEAAICLSMHWLQELPLRVRMRFFFM